MKSVLVIWLLIGWLHQPSKRLEKMISPAPEPFVAFRVETRNVPKAEVAGVILPAKGQARGTLFLCHGWGLRKEFLYGWDWIRDELGWNLVLFDFREHGQSTHTRHLCTLGYHEIWDVKAAVDHAQRLGLAEPYAICGYSLGAAVGLRWAAHDSRIRGVLAASPFRNGLTASEQFTRRRLGIDVSPFMHEGYAQMLRAVDLPTDVKRRDDLRIWIMVGERDIFPATDQRAILAASPAPREMKRLFVIPGARHSRLWSWRGDDDVPSHDQLIRDFLREVEGAPPPTD